MKLKVFRQITFLKLLSDFSKVCKYYLENNARVCLNKPPSLFNFKYLRFPFFVFFLNTAHAQCPSNATSTADEEILNVAFGTLNNTSTCATTGGAGSILNEYSNYADADFAGGVPDVNIGCIIPFSVQIGTCGGNYTNSIAVFIDWNNDLDFVDAGEQVYTSAAGTSGPHIETGNIIIPVTATIGNCRMRVVNVETSVPTSITSCGTYSWGETEDYLINITNAGATAPYISSSVNQIVSGPVSQCAYYQQIICVPVAMGAGCTAGDLTQFMLGAGSSTNLLADVSKIHIFYTGTSNVFLPINEFIAGGSTPTGAINTINGSQTLLANATNYFWIIYDMNPLSMIGNVIDGSCNQITVGGVNQTPATPNPADSGTIITCPCSFSLGNDTTICSPLNYTINGPTGYDSYTWSPGGATTQNITVITAGTYSCTATIINGGLVVNGDFTAGNIGFTSSYILGTGGAWGLLTNPGTYAITTSPNLVHNNFQAFGNHTSGTGNMMVCNGSDVANTIVWSQTIGVTTNTNYNFSAWVATLENISAGQQAQLQFSINGILIGTVFNAPLTYGNWSNFFINWNSGTNTSAVITIVDQSTAAGSNDFALDDISFEKICAYTDAKAITVNSNVTPTFTAVSPICSGGTLSALPTTSNNGITGTWSPALDNTATTIYTFTPTVGQCATTTTLTITVNSNVTPSFTAVAPICSGATLPALPITSNNGIAGTWSPALDNTATTIYTFTPTVGQCATTTTLTITVNSNVTSTFTAVSPICSGGALSALPTTSNNSITGIWSPVLDNTATTIYTFSPAAAQCATTTTLTITVDPIPSAAFTASPTTGTAPLFVSFANTSTNASTVVWNFGDGNTAGNLNTTTNTYPSAGTYLVILIGTNAAGCPDTAYTTIIVNQASCSFSLANDTVFCLNQSTLNFTINGPSGYDLYSWSPGGATTQNISATTNGTYSCIASISSGDLVVNGNFSSGNSGFTSNYTVGTGGTWGPVSNPGTYLVTTDPNLAHSNFMSFGDHTSGAGTMMICNGASIANTVVWNQSISVTPGTTYNFSAWVASVENISLGSEAQLQFSINGTLIGSVFNALLSGGQWSNFFVNWNSGANTSAIITIVDQSIAAAGNDFVLDDIFFQQLCTYTDSITINAISPPNVYAGTPQTIPCNTASVNLNGSSSTTGATYSWTGSGITSGNNSANPTVNNNGTYILTVTEPIAGCQNIDSVIVTVDVLPVAQFIATPTIGQAPLLVDFTNTSINSTSNSWIFGDGNSDFDINNPTNTYIEPGIYNAILIVSNNGVGCIDTAYYTIVVNAEVTFVIPNVFTPNGDGTNDLFMVTASGIKEFSCEIYDRWGLKMVELKSATEGWDGRTTSGSAASEGTYYFIIKAKDVNKKEYLEKGSFTLLK